MKVSPVIFREYDIRGLVGSELSDEFAYGLGRAYGSKLAESAKGTVGIGYDCRHSSKGFAYALARGIAEEGFDVSVIGMAPSPVLYYSIYKRKLAGGIQVTGSHNPSDMNGFKLCIGTHTLSGAEIQDLKARMEAFEKTDAIPEKKGKISEDSIIPEYVDEIVGIIKPHMGARKLKVVVDAGNGVGGMTGIAVLKALGVELIELFCDPDGDFPNHHPDPTVLKYLTHLSNTVREHKADFGIGWDGDADRIGVVDEKGEVIFADLLLLLYARQILEEKPGCTIIADVKCTHRLFEDLEKRGANIIMSKTGHSLMKAKLHETKGEIAGELSGHIFFNHRFFGFDDAVYASARFAEIVSAWDGPVSGLVADLPKTFCTPELKLDASETDKFIIPGKVAESFNGTYPVVAIDGARIKFPKGWALVRASNTQPCMILRFEAEDEASLKEYQELVHGKIEEIRAQLANSAA